MTLFDYFLLLRVSGVCVWKYVADCELREENGNVIYLLELEKWFDEIEVIYDANAKLLKEIK